MTVQQGRIEDIPSGIGFYRLDRIQGARNSTHCHLISTSIFHQSEFEHEGKVLSAIPQSFSPKSCGSVHSFCPLHPSQMSTSLHWKFFFQTTSLIWILHMTEL